MPKSEPRRRGVTRRVALAVAAVAAAAGMTGAAQGTASADHETCGSWYSVTGKTYTPRRDASIVLQVRKCRSSDDGSERRYIRTVVYNEFASGKNYLSVHIKKTEPSGPYVYDSGLVAPHAAGTRKAYPATTVVRIARNQGYYSHLYVSYTKAPSTIVNTPVYKW